MATDAKGNGGGDQSDTRYDGIFSKIFSRLDESDKALFDHDKRAAHVAAQLDRMEHRQIVMDKNLRIIGRAMGGFGAIGELMDKIE